MFVVHACYYVKPEREADFLRAAGANAAASREEKGVVRFDLLRREGAECVYFFDEMYRNEAAYAAHRETAHYRAWRACCGDFFSAPFSVSRFTVVEG